MVTSLKERFAYDIREGIDWINEKILAIQLLFGIGIYGIGISFFGTFENNYLTLYFQNQGLTTADQGLYFAVALGAGAIVFMIGALLGGVLSDDLRTRYGSRIPVIVVSTILAGLIMIFAVPILTILGNDLTAYALLFIVIHFLLGLAASPWYALVSDLLSKERRAWSALVTASLMTIGVGIGIFVIGRLIQDYDIFLWPVNGLLVITFTIISAILIPKVNPDFEPDSTLNDLLNSPSYLLKFGKGDFSKLFGISLLWGIGATSLSSFFTFYVRNLGWYLLDPIAGEGSIITLMLITAATGFIVAIPAGFLCNLIGKAKTGILGSLALALYFIFLLFSQTYESLRIVAIFGGIGGILLTTVGVALPADLMPEGKEGQFWSFILISRQISAPIALAIGGILIFAFNNFILLFLFNAGLMLLAALGTAFIAYENLSLPDYLLFHRRILRSSNIKTIRGRS
ncbi:MAG: MFS transporter [Promethearchaeota archaeon]